MVLDKQDRFILRTVMGERFNLDELEMLAFDLGVDFQNFHHDTKPGLIRELITYFERTDQVGCLVAEVLKKWSDNRLVDMLARIPPSSPRTLAQVILAVDLLEKVPKFKEYIAEQLGVSQDQVAVVAAAWANSMRLLIGLPRVDVNLQELSELLRNRGYTVSSIERFEVLDLLSQAAWRYLALKHPPNLEVDHLRPSVSWQEALERSKEAVSHPAIGLSAGTVIGLIPRPPASLFWLENRTRRATVLLQECWDIAKYGVHRPIDSILQDARHMESDDPEGSAAVLLHLSDLCRGSGRLGPALKFGLRASRLLSRLPESRHRYNYAVSLYSLALIHQLLGSDQEALDCYDQAIETFSDAKQEIVASRPIGWVERMKEADQVIGEMEGLIGFVSDALPFAGATAIACPVLIGGTAPLSVPRRSGFAMEVAVKSITVDIKIRAGAHLFTLASTDETQQEIVIHPGEEYFIREVPDTLASAISHFADAKYVLVRKSVPEEDDLGIGLTPSGDIVWGKFFKTEDGRGEFRVAYPPTPGSVRVVGVDELMMDSEKVIGLWKAA